MQEYQVPPNMLYSHLHAITSPPSETTYPLHKSKSPCKKVTNAPHVQLCYTNDRYYKYIYI